MIKQSGRQRRGTEWTEIVIEHTEMVGNVTGKPENDGEGPRKYGT